MRIILSFVLLAFIATSCYYDSEEFLFPQISGNCDTASVSFSEDVYPILLENCIICHSNVYAATLGGNIRLEDLGDVTSQSAKVLGAMSHEPDLSPMPKGGAKLVNCDILIFEAWVLQGKPDN